MADIKKTISIDEGLASYLDRETLVNPAFKGKFSRSLEYFLTKGINAHELERKEQVYLEKRRDGQVEKDPSLYGLPQSPGDNLEVMPDMRSD